MSQNYLKEDSKFIFQNKPIFDIPIDLIKKEQHLKESKRMVDKNHSLNSQKTQGAINNGGPNQNLL